MATRTSSHKPAILVLGGIVAMFGVALDTFQQYDVQPKLTAVQEDLAKVRSTAQQTFNLLVNGERNLTFAAIMSAASKPAERSKVDPITKPLTLYTFGFTWMRYAVQDEYALLQGSADSLEAQSNAGASPSNAACKLVDSQDTRVLNNEWGCFNGEARQREVADKKQIASLQHSLSLWSGVGRMLQVLGILIGLAKDLFN